MRSSMKFFKIAWVMCLLFTSSRTGAYSTLQSVF